MDPTTEKKLLKRIKDLDAKLEEQDEDEIDDEDEAPEPEPTPKAKKPRESKTEIAGASEATMQSVLRKLNRVDKLLSGENPDKAKARSILDDALSLFELWD